MHGSDNYTYLSFIYSWVFSLTDNSHLQQCWYIDIGGLLKDLYKASISL